MKIFLALKKFGTTPHLNFFLGEKREWCDEDLLLRRGAFTQSGAVCFWSDPVSGRRYVRLRPPLLPCFSFRLRAGWSPYIFLEGLFFNLPLIEDFLCCFGELTNISEAAATVVPLLTLALLPIFVASPFFPFLSSAFPPQQKQEEEGTRLRRSWSYREAPQPPRRTR